MNAIYAGSPGINFVNLFGYTSASCSSCHIPSNDCLIAVDFARFTHESSLPSTAFTGMNIPFTAGMPIVARQNFPTTDSNVFKYTRPLWVFSCEDFKSYSYLSGASYMHLYDP